MALQLAKLEMLPKLCQKPRESADKRRHQDAGTSGAAILHQTVVAVGVGGVDGVDHGIEGGY